MRIIESIINDFSGQNDKISQNNSVDSTIIESIIGVVVGEELKAIEAKYNEYLEDLTVFERKDSLEISMLKIKKEYRKQGYAKKIMQEILNYADKKGLVTVLTPEPQHNSISKANLEGFYRSLGFVPNKGRNKNWAFRETMIRTPKTSKVIESIINTYSNILSEEIIAYHGSNEPIRKFDKSFSAQGVFWFSDNKEKIVKGESGAVGTKYIIKASLNVKNPAGWDEYEKYGLDEIERMGFDSIHLDDDWVVFDAKNIKIIKVEQAPFESIDEITAYHDARRVFDKFEINKHTGEFGEIYGKGAYLTSDPHVADSFTKGSKHKYLRGSSIHIYDIDNLNLWNLENDFETAKKIASILGVSIEPSISSFGTIEKAMMQSDKYKNLSEKEIKELMIKTITELGFDGIQFDGPMRYRDDSKEQWYVIYNVNKLKHKYASEGTEEFVSEDKITVYHGTDVDFDKFDLSKTKRGEWGMGMYFSTDLGDDSAKGYGDKIYSAEIETKDLFDIANYNQAKEIASKLGVELPLKGKGKYREYDYSNWESNPYDWYHIIMDRMTEKDGDILAAIDLYKDIEKLGYKGISIPWRRWVVIFNPSELDLKKNESTLGEDRAKVVGKSYQTIDSFLRKLRNILEPYRQKLFYIGDSHSTASFYLHGIKLSGDEENSDREIRFSDHSKKHYSPSGDAYIDVYGFDDIEESLSELYEFLEEQQEFSLIDLIKKEFEVFKNKLEISKQASEKSSLTKSNNEKDQIKEVFDKIINQDNEMVNLLRSNNLIKKDGKLIFSRWNAFYRMLKSKYRYITKSGVSKLLLELQKVDPEFDLKKSDQQESKKNIAEAKIKYSSKDIVKFTGDLAREAQKAYDEWEQDEEGEDEELGCGGICQNVADNMSFYLSQRGIDAASVSQQIDDQHVYVVAKLADGVFNIDIPPSRYEIGSGYTWKKRKNVKFDPSFVQIDRLSSDPDEFESFIEESRMMPKSCDSFSKLINSLGEAKNFLLQNALVSNISTDKKVEEEVCHSCPSRKSLAEQNEKVTSPFLTSLLMTEKFLSNKLEKKKLIESLKSSVTSSALSVKNYKKAGGCSECQRNFIRSKKSLIAQKKTFQDLFLKSSSITESELLSKSIKRNMTESLQSSVTISVSLINNWSRHVHDYFSNKKDLESTRSLFLTCEHNLDLSKVEPLNGSNENSWLFRVRLDDSEHRLILRGKITYNIFYIDGFAFFNYPEHKSYAHFLDSVDKDKIDFHESSDELTEVSYKDIYGQEFEAMRKKYAKNTYKKYGHFTNFTSGDSLEKNPYEDPNHSDPVGVYGYPLDYIIKNPADVWYGQKAKYLRILDDDSKNKLMLQDVTELEGQDLLMKMFDWRVSEVEKRWKEAKKLFKNRIGTGSAKDARIFFQVFQMDWYSTPEREKEPAVRSGAEQTRLLRKVGIDAVEDTAKKDSQAVINSREPEQVIFLHRNAFKVEEVITLAGVKSTSVGTSDDPDYLTRKLAALLATGMGDILTSDKEDTVGKGGWSFFWTKQGKQIEINFSRPESYYVDKVIGQKKHREAKFSTPYGVRVNIRTPIGEIGVGGAGEISFETIIKDAVQRWEQRKADPQPGEFHSKAGLDKKDKENQEEYRDQQAQKEDERLLKFFEQDIWEPVSQLAQHYHVNLSKPATDEDKALLAKALNWFSRRSMITGYEQAKQDISTRPEAGKFAPYLQLIDRAIQDAKTDEGKRFKSLYWLARDIEEQGKMGVQEEGIKDWARNAIAAALLAGVGATAIAQPSVDVKKGAGDSKLAMQLAVIVNQMVGKEFDVKIVQPKQGVQQIQINKDGKTLASIDNVQAKGFGKIQAKVYGDSAKDIGSGSYSPRDAAIELANTFTKAMNSQNEESEKVRVIESIIKEFSSNSLNQLSEDVSGTTWYHGGAQKYKSLIPGDGMDGPGIYLTNDRQRAEMYSKKDVFGNENKTPYVHEVKVNISPDKIWDYSKKYDLRDFANEQQKETWIKDLIKEYGEKATIKDGQNAKIYLGWLDDNEELKKRGYQAILNNNDLVVLDPSVILSVESKFDKLINSLNEAVKVLNMSNHFTEGMPENCWVKNVAVKVKGSKDYWVDKENSRIIYKWDYLHEGTPSAHVEMYKIIGGGTKFAILVMEIDPFDSSKILNRPIKNNVRMEL